MQTTLNFYDRPGIENKFIVQDAAIPRGVANLFSLLLRDRYLDNSMVMLAMGHDEGRGEFVWKDGRYQISWPGLKDSEYRMKMFRECEQLACVEGSRYKRLKAFGNNLVTVHPLGGCGMADSPECGVVNDRGQVFDGRSGGSSDAFGQATVHSGLYVADGSVIPTAVGVNPYLTICAVTERIAANLVRDPQYADMFNI
ncbi:MAG: GMC family oxidoreductase [Pirellulaceae bacterium]